MDPASFLGIPRALFIGVISGAAFVGACCASPALEHALRTLLQIVWLYFSTGVRG